MRKQPAIQVPAAIGIAHRPTLRPTSRTAPTGRGVSIARLCRSAFRLSRIAPLRRTCQLSQPYIRIYSIKYALYHVRTAVLTQV